MKKIILLLVCFFITPITFAEPKQTMLQLGAENSWSPYSDKNGQGISTNIINAAFAKVGIATQITVRPYARVLQDVKVGRLDACYNVTRQENTENEFIFGAEPILKARAYWYFAAGSTMPKGSLSDFPNNYRIGSIISYGYGDLFEQQRYRFKEFRVHRQAQLVKMLQQGRIDAAIMYEDEAKQGLKDMGLPADTLQRGMYNNTSDIYLAFSRQREHAAEYAKEFDKGLKLLKASGEYTTLLQNDNLGVREMYAKH